jgi:hypothetical protein
MGLRWHLIAVRQQETELWQTSSIFDRHGETRNLDPLRIFVKKAMFLIRQG